MTPDFGRSDVWNFSFPTKYALGEALHANTLPLWSPHMGTGFPLLGEGQTGIFYLPNLILFKLFAPEFAYNLILLLVFFMLGTGMFVFLSYQKYHPLAAFFGGVFFMFGGLPIVQIPHITLMQGFSLMPWILYVTCRLIDNPTKISTGILALLISQQIFAGFPQATFITLLTAGVLLFLRVSTLRHFIAHAGRFLLAVGLGFGLGATQLLPSYEFLKQTGAAAGFSGQTSTYFSLPPLHLVSFIAPYTFGNPKDGTYPPFTEFDGSIFWENTGYIGFIPLAFFLFLLKERKRLTPKQKRLITVFLYLLVGAALLMFGSHSPFYFIFSIWPFNLFRAPSRFLWVFLFALVTISMAGAHIFLEYTKKFRLVTWVIALMMCINLSIMWWYWWEYHPYEPMQTWLAKPEIMKDIQTEKNVYSAGVGSMHNTFFLSDGWKSMAPYRWLRNTLDPSTPGIWGVTTSTVYAGRFLHRQTVLDSLIQSEIQLSTTEATISALGKKMLDIYSIGSFISTVPINTNLLQSPKRMTYQDTHTLNIFTNTTALPKAYIATNSAVASTIVDAKTILASSEFIPGQSVVVENSINLTGSGSAGKVQQVINEPTIKQFTVAQNQRDGILVVDQTYYPGWEARINGELTPIIPVNIRQQGIVLPPGEHSVTMTYKPRMFYFGAIISGISHAVLMGLILFAMLFGQRHTVQNTP